ncbi:hypothetical protein QRZ34_27355 [Klebsiella michiganensis]|jgi:hypothetical protein|uniref:hypothetical protein n=1 Tax=Klebsiella michiganensis TaxID=1134687 RepID=UPI002570F00B|nr:hypothetical protein [Klebsiella michiganensis]MDL4454756.1 hypothetical protein [Klebsiella michiganensis]
MSKDNCTEVKSVKLATFGKAVTLAGAVPRTLSGQEAGRVLGFGCHHGGMTDANKK